MSRDKLSRNRALRWHLRRGVRLPSTSLAGGTRRLFRDHLGGLERETGTQGPLSPKDLARVLLAHLVRDAFPRPAPMLFQLKDFLARDRSDVERT